jgi:hypothetical protein
VRIVALHDEVCAHRSARAGKLLMRWRTHSQTCPRDAEPEASEPHTSFPADFGSEGEGSVAKQSPIWSFGSLFSLLLINGLALSYKNP